MILPDVNVLVHAIRTDAVDHERCHAWLEAAAQGIRPLGLTGGVLASVVRVTTHPRVFPEQSQTADVVAILDELLAAPSVVMLEPGPKAWAAFRELTSATGVTGNLVPDAWLAAIAMAHGATVVTLDRDFARFRGVRVESP